MVGGEESRRQGSRSSRMINDEATGHRKCQMSSGERSIFNGEGGVATKRGSSQVEMTTLHWRQQWCRLSWSRKLCSGSGSNKTCQLWLVTLRSRLTSSPGVIS